MTILTYHAIDPGWQGPLSVPPDLFARQLAWLQRGRPIVALDDAVAPSGVAGPSDAIALTFDDAFTSVYEHAMPVLERMRVPATIFLIAKTLDPAAGGYEVDWVDRPPAHALRVLDRAQVKELRAAGVRFGSHSYGHQDLTTLGYEACLEDLRRSRAVLEDLLGEPVTALAYPRGRHDETVRRAAADAGFVRSFGLAVPEPIRGAQAVPRVGVYPADMPWSLWVKTRGWYGRFRASGPYPWLRRRVERFRPGAPPRRV
jgi:peptidoglycan/xylan/chitin deacetylase (PgdA/CDA1 family)